jgi:SAM-dependent methyltransferase
MNAYTGKGIKYVDSEEFQDKVRRDSIKWDKEWMRYFSIHKDYNFYFYDMDTDHYALSYSLRQIAKFSKKEMYSTKLFKNIASGIWVPGIEVVGKKVVEMGCGPGIFGRIAGRFADKYVGIDISQFALHIARLTSPKTCQYVHLSEVSALREIVKTMDTSVSRNFFIHHNYSDSLWILRFLRDLIKPGGIISADFYYKPELVDGDRRRSATDSLNEEHPSSLFNFTNDDILRIAADLKLECVDIDIVPELERQFATLRVP